MYEEASNSSSSSASKTAGAAGSYVSTSLSLERAGTSVNVTRPRSWSYGDGRHDNANTRVRTLLSGPDRFFVGWFFWDGTTPNQPIKRGKENRGSFISFATRNKMHPARIERWLICPLLHVSRILVSIVSATECRGEDDASSAIGVHCNGIWFLLGGDAKIVMWVVWILLTDVCRAKLLNLVWFHIIWTWRCPRIPREIIYIYGFSLGCFRIPSIPHISSHG